MFGMQWVMPDTVKEALQSWSHRTGKRIPRACRVAPLTIMWVIWKAHIRRAFEGLEQDFVKMQSSVLSLVAFWCFYEFLIC